MSIVPIQYQGVDSTRRPIASRREMDRYQGTLREKVAFAPQNQQEYRVFNHYRPGEHLARITLDDGQLGYVNQVVQHSNETLAEGMNWQTQFNAQRNYQVPAPHPELQYRTDYSEQPYNFPDTGFARARKLPMNNDPTAHSVSAFGPGNGPSYTYRAGLADVRRRDPYTQLDKNRMGRRTVGREGPSAYHMDYATAGARYNWLPDRTLKTSADPRSYAPDHLYPTISF